MVSNFIDYVIPSRTILDYSVDNSITLDFARFYPNYSNSSVTPFNTGAGTFSGNLAPLFQMRHMPKGFSEIPQVPTYSPIGLAMNFEYFPIESGKKTGVNEYRISNIEYRISNNEYRSREKERCLGWLTLMAV